mgnify:CR=1 FL=1
MNRKKQGPAVAPSQAGASPAGDVPKRGRSRRKERSRERVIQAALDLFVRQGFDETTVRQIVAAGGISMRTFFRYFPTKLDLAFPRSEEGSERLQELLREHRDAADPLGGVSAALVEFGRWYMSLREDLLREWKYESRSKELIARGAEIERRNRLLIATELEECGLPGSSARFLASVIFGAIGSNLEEWFGNECGDDLVEASRGTLVLIRSLDRTFLRGDSPAMP